VSRRTEKIGSELRTEVARLLREDVTDPRVRLVTITRIDVAPDLSHAVLYYSVMDAAPDDEAAIEAVDDGLHSAAPFLRRRAARVLPLRRMPELRFRYDPSLSLGTRTLSVLRELEAGRPAEGQGPPPDAREHTAEQGGDDGEEA
jgi:ribosome-binding factor A